MANPITPVTPPPPPWGVERLGAKIETMLQRVAILALNAIKDAISSIFSVGIELTIENIEQAAAPRLAPIINKILETPDLPQWVADYLQHIRNPTAQADVFGIGASSQAVASNVQAGLLAPVMRIINYTIDSQLHTARPDPGTSFRAYWRGKHERENLEIGLKQLGWHQDFFPALEETLRPRLSPMDLIEAARRSGENVVSTNDDIAKFGYTTDDIDRIFTISERLLDPSTLIQYAYRVGADPETMAGELRRLGFKDVSIAILLELSKQKPGASDLISMAVREAFSEDQIAQFNLDAELPDRFVEEMQLQGFSYEWARRYWIAHWQLPSTQMGYEMLHRGEIDPDQLDMLLKALDVSPFWRDKLANISYSLLTRVDIRRLYAEGILDESDVYTEYRKRGYNEQDAQRLTDFAIADATQEDREATKTDILAGFHDGVLTQEETVTWLQEIGFPSEVAQYLVAREALAVERREAKEWLGIVEDLFTNGDITETEARVRLTALNFPSSQIERSMQAWKIARQKATKRPTQAQLDDFLLQDIIDIDAYQDGLTRLGFQQQYIDWYTFRVLDKKATQARKAEQEARDEQEAIRQRRARSDYQTAKAQLDVDESELKTAIAENQVALETRRNRFKRELAIAKRTLSVAELQAQADSDTARLNAEIDDLREASTFLTEQIDNVETEAAELKAEIVTGVSDERAETIARRLASLQVRKEELQDDRAQLAVQVAQKRTQINQRREQLRQELDLAGRIGSEAELREQYLADTSEIEQRIGALRINLAQIREQKAQLSVEYRQGIAEA